MENDVIPKNILNDTFILIFADALGISKMMLISTDSAIGVLGAVSMATAAGTKYNIDLYFPAFVCVRADSYHPDEV